MSAQELYRRWLEDLWGKDPAIAHELVSPDFVGHWPDRDVVGPDELATRISQTRALFTDLTFVVQIGPLVDGEYVAARWSGLGSSPDGELSFFGNDILRVADGKFVEYWTASTAG